MMAPPYLLLGNGTVAARFLAAAIDRGMPPERVVLNAPEKQRGADAIRQICSDQRIAVVEWSADTRAALLREFAERRDTWLLSVYFAHRIEQELLDRVGGRAVNLHPSLLPWGRGAHTNVWPIVEHCPAGVTLHVMEAEIDRGAILAQVEVPIAPSDTAATLYQKLETSALALLLDMWPAGVLARWPGREQPCGGSEHRIRDLATLDNIDVDSNPDLRRFFDILRARSYPPHPGIRLRVDGRIVEATILLRDVENEPADDPHS